MRSHPAAEIWPPARLEVVTPRLSLRLPTDEELYALADVAAAGVHRRSEMPFSSPWSDAPPDEVRRGLLAWHWTARADFTRDSWTLELGVFVDGEPAGCQGLMARQFGVRRVVDTGSWLGSAFQGRGIGTEMRQAVLELAFGSLGAERAQSDAYVDNPASLSVSEKCGYEPNGEFAHRRRRGPLAPGGEGEERAASRAFCLRRERWLELRRSDIEVRGVDDDMRFITGADVDRDAQA